jgi:hypothetical protein
MISRYREFFSVVLCRALLVLSIGACLLDFAKNLSVGFGWLFGGILPSVVLALLLRKKSSIQQVSVLNSLPFFLVLLASCLTVHIVGWSSHKAYVLIDDEQCGIRQSVAFEKYQMTLSRQDFPSWFDPTSPCFARSEKGYFSVQAPGWAAVMALGNSLGVPRERLPWLLASTSLLTVAAVGFVIGGLPLGLGLLIALYSNQFFDSMSRSFWGHTAAMTAVGIVTLCVVLVVNTGSARNKLVLAGVSGGATGVIILTRPLVGISVAIFYGLFLLIEALLVKSKRNFCFQAGMFLIGPTLAVLLYGLFNQGTTGSFLTSGYEFLYGTGHNPGFNRLSPNGVVHTPARGYLLLRHHVRDLLSFILPSKVHFFGLLALAVGIGWSRSVGYLLVLVLCMWLGAATYWDSSYFVGPRFYYESLVPLLVVMISILWNSIKNLTELVTPYWYRDVLGIVCFAAALISIIPSPPLK